MKAPHAHNHQYEPVHCTSFSTRIRRGIAISAPRSNSFTRSSHHVFWVEVLNPKRSSRRNCFNQLAGIDKSERNTPVRKMKAACTEAEFPNVSIRAPENAGRTPEKSITANITKS